ncbi:MAG TPA: hypothetical protein VD930_09775 [Gemmatimonadales bacterium]|nr:hypothetical protein [Gemmatimonadales bacterium]
MSKPKSRISISGQNALTGVEAVAMLDALNRGISELSAISADDPAYQVACNKAADAAEKLKWALYRGGYYGADNRLIRPKSLRTQNEQEA